MSSSILCSPHCYHLCLYCRSIHHTCESWNCPPTTSSWGEYCKTFDEWHSSPAVGSIAPNLIQSIESFINLTHNQEVKDNWLQNQDRPVPETDDDGSTTDDYIDLTIEEEEPCPPPPFVTNFIDDHIDLTDDFDYLPLELDQDHPQLIELSDSDHEDAWIYQSIFSYKNK